MSFAHGILFEMDKDGYILHIKRRMVLLGSVIFTILSVAVVLLRIA